MSKPVFYTFGLSVWAAAPEIAIVELGYPAEAIQKKIVNVAEGANFAPEFLKINPNGTLPSLVADGKAYTSTDEVIKYLVANAPKKVTPGTSFITRIHGDDLDPNFPLLATRNEDELAGKKEAFPLIFLQNRQDALVKYSTSPEGAEFKDFYEKKIPFNGGLLAVYKGEVPDEAKQGFFGHSTGHWQTLVNFIQNELPTVLPDSGFLGGAEPGEDDFHLAAWLARVAHFTGATPQKGGYKSLEKETQAPVPAKVGAYWDAWTERPGWQATYPEGLH